MTRKGLLEMVKTQPAVQTGSLGLALKAAADNADKRKGENVTASA